MDNIATEMEALERVFSDESAEPIRLSYGLLRSVTDNFSKEIGRGGFGVVYMGYLGNGKVAVKKLSNPHALPDKQFLGEITCLKKANHKNIVRFLGYCSETQGELHEFNGENVMAEVQKKLLCFEYVPNGNIRHYLQQEKPQGDDWPARYQMIIGICHGLLCLHEKHINHLDLKPENVMLDAQMEPKITDFGLSRFLDQGQSKMVTQHIVGTLRYVAPEIIDQGEISLKSDIYALGVIIIELLTGISMISVDNWDESLNEDCPRARRCTEIARNCIDHDKQNRPTVWEVITDLDEIERMIPQSSLNKVTPIVFLGNEMFDVYPLELRFPFVPNQEMHCHLSVTNKHIDDGIYCIINPRVPDRYSRLFRDILLPMSTTAITLRRKAEEELPSDMDEVEIVILITGCDENEFHEKMAMLPPNNGVTSCDDMLKAAHELLGFELHRTMLTAVVVAIEDDDQVLVADTAGKGDETFWISSIDVHPMEPWVLSIQGREAVYVWNWQTNKKIGEYWSCVEIPECHGEAFDGKHVAKFIPRKQWVVIGNSRGSILVRTCPPMNLVKEFKAHREPVTSLAVHSARPFLLSCSNQSLSLKLWDWSRDWSCIATFDLASHVREIMFNPKHASTFATLGNDGIVEMWRIGQPDPVARTHKLDHFGSTHFFTYRGDQHFIAASNDELICIWDLQSEKHIHTLHIEEGTVAIVCHPTHPLLFTASKDGSIRVWDSTTYRLKNAYANLPKDPIHIGFTSSRRLVIGYIKGILVLDIHLE